MLITSILSCEGVLTRVHQTVLGEITVTTWYGDYRGNHTVIVVSATEKIIARSNHTILQTLILTSHCSIRTLYFPVHSTFLSPVKSDHVRCLAIKHFPSSEAVITPLNITDQCQRASKTTGQTAWAGQAGSSMAVLAGVRRAATGKRSTGRQNRPVRKAAPPVALRARKSEKKKTGQSSGWARHRGRGGGVRIRCNCKISSSFFCHACSCVGVGMACYRLL